MLGVCLCVHVTVGSALSAAVDISTVVMGALFSSRCRQYHLSVMLHRHDAYSKKKKKTPEKKCREGGHVGRKIKKAEEGSGKRGRGKVSG